MGKKLTAEDVNYRLRGRDVKMIGAYVKALANTDFECDKCGNVWQARPSHVMDGSGCPKCAIKNITSSKDIVNERIINSGIQLTGEYLGSAIKTKFRCEHGHSWDTTPHHVINGSGCPHCAKLTKDDINNRLMGRGIELIGEYLGSRINTEFIGKCGHKWLATPDNVVRGTGCRSCSTTGYNTGKSGYVYIIKYETYIKYGITNNLNKRLKKHKKSGNYELIISKLCVDGNVAAQWERNIKVIFGGNYVSKDVMPDGYTETLNIDKLPLLIDTIKELK